MQAGALEAGELYCRRGERLLFGALDLRLESGEALHITGPNGVGKSSLIQILAGLRRPSFAPDLAAATKTGRGIVTWHGEVGLVDERPALDPDLPLGRALQFWQRVDRCGDPTGAIEAMGIGELLEVPVRYLSTGQRKRAAFAALLARGAANWLLDEPLNGLDNDARAKVEALIALHCGGGGTAIVASHQPINLPGDRTLDIRDHPW